MLPSAPTLHHVPLQMNEVLRENKFMNFSPNRTNIVGLTAMLVAFPLFFHWLTTREYAIRDAKFPAASPSIKERL